MDTLQEIEDQLAKKGKDLGKRDLGEDSQARAELAKALLPLFKPDRQYDHQSRFLDSVLTVTATVLGFSVVFLSKADLLMTLFLKGAWIFLSLALVAGLATKAAGLGVLLRRREASGASYLLSLFLVWGVLLRRREASDRDLEKFYGYGMSLTFLYFLYGFCLLVAFGWLNLG